MTRQSGKQYNKTHMLFNIPLVRSLGLMPLHTFQAASQDVAQLPAWKTTWSDKGRFSKPGTGHQTGKQDTGRRSRVSSCNTNMFWKDDTHTPQKTLER